jgi:hypothetical protein
MAQWLTLLVRIRVVPGSNLGQETGYPDRFFMVSLSPSIRMAEKATEN